MAPTRVLLMHPGAAWSTHDVYVGMRAGLEAIGCEVIAYRLDEALSFYGHLFEAAERGGLVWGDGKRPNLHGFAGMKGIMELVNVWPDYMIAVSGHNLHYSVPLMSRKLGIPSAVYCTESPYFDHEPLFAQHYDVIFTNEARAVPSFDKHAPGRAHYLAHAYNPQIHTPGAPEAGFEADVFFVGSGFPERRRLFEGADWTGIKFVTHGFMWREGENPDALEVDRVLANEDAARYYRTAGISLNHHRTTTVYGANQHISGLDAESLGPRAYEIAACGGFQLMDDSRDERRRVFGDTMPTYRSHSSIDLERQIRYYLARPDERARLAAAQREAIAPHSWHRRAAEMMDVITASVRPAGRVAA